ncbi:TerB family tellurite resistance protein [Fulvimarina endophytica]|nr:TerB family tellurite resistance protein [Fulvimarina endophytica]
MHRFGTEFGSTADGGEDDLNVAIAALLYHVVSADGVVTQAERASLLQVLQDDYAMTGEEADRVARAGEKASDEAVDLYHFTSLIKNRLDETARIEIVRHLWQVTYADGEVHELEDNVVWRVSELLGVSGRDRMLLKKEFADRIGAEG